MSDTYQITKRFEYMPLRADGLVSPHLDVRVGKDGTAQVLLNGCQATLPSSVTLALGRWLVELCSERPAPTRNDGLENLRFWEDQLRAGTFSAESVDACLLDYRRDLERRAP